ncbi:magnesium citrate secondary transporter [Pontibacter beigongshangensis]|uniref:magnesium citrate secondary transporter n=1 Tax=Pontibacter beigongshangensis TaxID=2574733 RepID=UPI00164F79DE|nr:magnesium citrate secondary transporter [Pontibacter beigongshangensis]
MQTLRHPFFLLCFFLFLLNQVLELSGIFLWPLHTHLDDLLCLPLALTVVLAAERWYFKRPGFVLPVSYILSAFAVFAVVFELLLPLFFTRYTADALDVQAYAAGGLAFYLILNKPLP